MRAWTLVFTFATAVSAVAGVAFARQRGDDQRATVREVMTSMTIPSSDEIFEAASSPPATDERWADLRLAAETLAESGRLLTTSRLAKDAGTWMDMAAALVKEAERTSEIAKTRDVAALEASADSIYMTCKTCHDGYMEGRR